MQAAKENCYNNIIFVIQAEKMAEPEAAQTFGMSEKELMCTVSEKHRNEIANEIGGDWESLATFIGVPPKDVDGTKDTYRKPLDRRLAMMKRWHELWGRDATYSRLVEGLRQIGRRDLIELLTEKAHLVLSASGSKSFLNYFRNQWSRNVRHDCILYMNAALIVFVAILLIVIILDRNTYNAIPNSESGTDRQYLTKNITYPVALHHRIVSDCSSPESDLPKIHPLFVGRENDVHQVLLKVARAHLVNINGAPGFGKSTLVIHVGYEVVKNGTSVRYINIEERMFSIVNHWLRSKEKAKSEYSSKNDDHPINTTSLTKPSRSSLSNLNYSDQMTSSEHVDLIKELQRWSKEMKCTKVLILDNCDNILKSEYRQQFLSLINTLVMMSKFKLHIVLVSQERLLYLEDFDCWEVKELTQSASIEMLDKLAPAIDNETLRTAAKLIEGCPLALKVIGQLLHIHGAKLMPKLKKELIALLDDPEVSDPKQRFRIIMEGAFKRLGILKDCGYVLSLFPGSFDEQAGTAIVQKECLELYFKHSLLNEYSLAYNYRYKMHRLIKEYLQEKISIRQNTTFIMKFRAYFESLLLKHVMSQGNDKSETKKYSLSLELHNLDYLKELLLTTNMHLSSKELAVLGLLSDIDLIQFEQLHRYYTLYIENIHEVCPLLYNLKLCGKMYSTVVRHLYRKCKCETIWAYLQNFVKSPCMEYFQCKVARYLHDLESHGVMHLSHDESTYIDIILSWHCKERYHTDDKMRNHLIINNNFTHIVAVLVVILGFYIFVFLGSGNSCVKYTFIAAIPYRSFLQDLVRILHNSCKLYLAPTYPQESCKILQDLYMGIKNLAFYSKILQLDDFKNKDARFLARKC